VSQDLPLYSQPVLRGSDRFASLDRARGMDLELSIGRFDALLDHGEGNDPAGEARGALINPSRSVLVEVHRLLFPGRPGSGSFRESAVPGVYPGQDCPEPRFIARSLDNFEKWLTAESFEEIHPVEQAALSLTRLVDIWPFGFGNHTAAVVFSNQFLLGAGYPPFFVLQDEIAEFNEILSQAIRIQTGPLVRAISKCLERELELVGS